MSESTNATSHQEMSCPQWRTLNRGPATVYEFDDVLIEAQTEGGKEKICRVGSELIHVPFKEINEDSELWEVGKRGTLRVNRDGFERIFFDGFIKRLGVGEHFTVR
jgi:hypothetical protein